MLRKIFFAMAMVASIVFCSSFNMVEMVEASPIASVSDTLEEKGEFEFNTGEELYQKILSNLQEDNKDFNSYIVLAVPDEKFKEEEDVWMEVEAVAKQRQELRLSYRQEIDDENKVTHYFVFHLNRN